jgi:Ca-activated chloride channel homolog
MQSREWIPYSSGRASALGILLFSISAAGQGQSPVTPQPEQNTGLTLRVDTTLVQIPVAVTDSLNRFVLGLQKQDFHLIEDGVEQNIVHFSGEDAPLSVGLVFDESGSMDYKLRTSQAAVAQFLKTMYPGDEAFLVEFSDAAKLAVEFTGNPGDIQDALKKAQPGGLTAMLDAINMALREMKRAKNSRKAIVIVSDGGDNHSKYTAAEIESLVREADVQIYAMGVFEPSLSFGLSPEEVSGPKLLSEIATQTGGRAFSAALMTDLPSVAARIAIELRNQYVLGYYPKNQTKDGKYRHVEVKLEQPHGVSTLKAHWRLGYCAQSPGSVTATRHARRQAWRPIAHGLSMPDAAHRDRRRGAHRCGAQNGSAWNRSGSDAWPWQQPDPPRR